jgi:cyclopropane fatty-acyl-phospholipid synthase-like methyltransferase
MLYPIRDRVLDHAALRDGDTLLDIGCGDGLIAFGALEKSPASRIIFSDISQDLLDHARSLAHQTRADRGGGILHLRSNVARAPPRPLNGLTLCGGSF